MKSASVLFCVTKLTNIQKVTVIGNLLETDDLNGLLKEASLFFLEAAFKKKKSVYIYMKRHSYTSVS